MTQHRLPTPGSDDGTWGDILNDFLTVAHNSDGTLQAGSVTTTQVQDGSLPSTKLDSAAQATLSAVASKYTKPAGGIPVTDLTSAAQTSLTKASSSVQTVNAKTPDGSGAITLVASDVGAPTTLAQLTDVTTAGVTNSQVLSYNASSSKWIPATVTSTTVSDASNTTKGILELAGDLAGSNDATNPTISAGAITDAKVAANAAIQQSKIQNLTTNLAAKAPLASPTFTGTVTVPTPVNTTDATTKAYVDSAAISGTPDASTSTKGKVQLAGDLAGTAASPTVAKVNGVALPASAPSSGQVLTATSSSATSWTAPANAPVSSVAGRTGAVTLTSADVGLANVDNTADVNKPISAATQTALNAKAPLASPTFTGTVTVPTPVNTTDATTKAYVDSAASTGTPDASSSTKGKLLLAGDLGGTASSPSVLGIDGVAVSGTPSTGQVLIATNSAAAAWSAPPAAPVSSVAGRTGAVTLAEADISNLTSDLAGKVPSTRLVSAGTGLTGGGDLSADRSLAVAYGTTSGTATQGNDSRITGALQAGNNLSDLASTSTALSNLGAAVALASTAVKTTTYTATANQLIPADATTAGFTVTLPTAPADKTRVTVKKIDSSANVVTVASAGSDVFNKASGATSVPLSLQNQAVSVQYSSGSSIWYVVGDDLPLSSLNTSLSGTYAQQSQLGAVSGIATLNGSSQLVSSQVPSSVVRTTMVPGHPTTGTWQTDQAIIDSNGIVWICTAGGTPGTWAEGSSSAVVLDSTATDIQMDGAQAAGSTGKAADAGHVHPSDTSRAPLASPTFTGVVTAPAASVTGLTGATAGGRYIGTTTSGAPTSGTFALGDWGTDQTGKRWTCTVAGTPGTWVQEPGSGGSPATSTSQGIVQLDSPTPASPSSLTAVQVKTAQPPVLVNPKGLRRWRRALADALYGEVPIFCVGDSITAGQGADNTPGTFNNIPDNTQGWVGQLRQLFNKTYGDCGEGLILYSDTRVTPSASNDLYSGPLRHGASMTTSQSMTITQPTVSSPYSALTQIGVIQSNVSGDTTGVYTINGGSSTSLPALTNTGTFVENDIAVTAGQVLKVSGPASGQTHFGAFILKTAATAGVQVHRIGIPGYVVGDAMGGQSSGVLNGTSAQQTQAIRSCYQWSNATYPGLMILSFCVNDAGGQAGSGLAGGVTLSLYTSWMQQIVNQAVADGLCVLLLGEPPDYLTFSPSTEAQYHAAMKSIAASTDHCAALDVIDLWGSNALATSSDMALMAASTPHPYRRGHGDMARMVFEALTSTHLPSS